MKMKKEHPVTGFLTSKEIKPITFEVTKRATRSPLLFGTGIPRDIGIRLEKVRLKKLSGGYKK